MSRQFSSETLCNLDLRCYFFASVLVCLFFIVVVGNAFGSEPAFGRLFTTPEQRASLDKLRKQGGLQASRPIVSNETETRTLEQATSVTPQEIKLAGILWRADGKHKIWLSGLGSANDQTILGNSKESANLKVPLRGVGQGAILKPGQVWVDSNHRVEEAYRQVVPKPVAASSTKKIATSSSSSIEVQSSAQSSQK
jgi:hypothetical protein